MIARYLIVLGLLGASAALAQGGAPTPVYAAKTLARVQVAKVNFYESVKKGCPAPVAACRRAAYLRAGDVVLVGESKGAMVEVSFTAGAKAMTEGWVPRSAIVALPAPAQPLTAWRGTWVRDDEASITITPGKRPGSLIFKGDAAWGTHDPARVERGGVNVGELENMPGSPVGGQVRLGKPGAYECGLVVRLIGPYLAVDDNNMCGGNNVSFSGIYRQPKR